MRNTKLAIIIILLCQFYSCGLRKKMVYFQTEEAKAVAANYTPTFKTDDLLSIVVMADNPETVVPFNLPPTSGNINNSGYQQGNPERNGYLVDEKGEVNLPIIGKVQLAGMKRTEATALLQEKFSEYLKNPVVNIQIVNYKITVLGDVKSPGTFKIPNERITILEAIGLAGDMTITGKRKNVLIIRDKDGIKEQHRVDLTKSDEVFNPEFFYLQQNDVVYVEPNVAARTNGSFWKTSASIFISTAAVIISTISVVSK